VIELTIRLLGNFAVADREGKPVSVPGAKQRALLAYLALNVGKPISRDRLMTLLWGERFDEQARQSLRQALTKIRKLTSGDRQLLQSEGDSVSFAAEAVDVDVLEFEGLASDESPSAPARAVELYAGELLDNLIIREAAFDEWASGERARFNTLACTVFERAARHQQSEGQLSAAIDTAQRLIKLDPLREASHRLLMTLFAASGQRAAALKQYASCASLLSVELGVEPDAETKRLLHEIRMADEKRGSRSVTGTATAPASPASVKPTVAILPVRDISDDASAMSLARGMTEDIVAALTRYHWFAVLGRFVAADSPDQLLGIAQEQGADYGLEGSIRKLGDQLRVNVQLIELRSGRYVWVQRFDREFKNAFAVQDEIVDLIVGGLEPAIATAEWQRAREKDEASLDAWDCYHLGLAAQYEFSKEGNLEAQRMFRKAAEMDGTFAAAHARLAYAMVIGAIYFEAKPVEEILEEALRLAQTAARLDDQDAIARFALGRAHLARGEYETSLRELESAIELNPTFAQAHCALGDSLAYAGRLDEAVPCFQEAMRISPRDPYLWAFLTYGAMAHLFRHDHETAAKWAADAVRVPNAHYGANLALISALGHLGRKQECAAAIAELSRIRPDLCCDLARERLFYLKDEGQLEHYIEGLRKAGLPE
jgi:DNA-binding SARP family transcriptional activator